MRVIIQDLWIFFLCRSFIQILQNVSLSSISLFQKRKSHEKTMRNIHRQSTFFSAGLIQMLMMRRLSSSSSVPPTSNKIIILFLYIFALCRLVRIIISRCDEHWIWFWSELNLNLFDFTSWDFHVFTLKLKEFVFDRKWMAFSLTKVECQVRKCRYGAKNLNG